jgi:ATP-binding cassette subfamily F protein uup
LADYAGTVLLVSYDRDFLDRVVTSVVASEGNGRWIEYAGGYTDMLAQRAEAPPGSPPTKARCVKQAQPAPQSGTLPSGLPRRMNFNDRRALDMLPARIAVLETHCAIFSCPLFSPNFALF